MCGFAIRGKSNKCHRLVYDHISQAGGAQKVVIDREMINSVRVANNRYKQAQAEKQQKIQRRKNENR